ncbi:zf-HC2 domain-containing protein [Spirillospora sp. NPDC047279]|uniref:zf-HC2 domain-containing protein n=1 Tax=Spirillospora sp. NPDC047279 TaxID=3155478 RepID=UPI0033EF206E
MRATLGVYVLGAIDPAERSQIETHLSACPSCRDELAALAALPALLGRVNEAQIAQVAGPPEEMLDSLLAKAADERRRPLAWLAGANGARGGDGGRRGRVSRWAPAAAAAAVLLVVGGLVGGAIGVTSLAGDDRPVAVRTVTPPPTPPTVPPKAEQLIARSPDGKLEARVMLYKKRWGTRVEFYLRGAPYEGSCRLYAVAKNGQRDPLGSWFVAYRRGYGEYPASTMIPRDQLFSFEVVTVEGQPLLTVPA